MLRFKYKILILFISVNLFANDFLEKFNLDDTLKNLKLVNSVINLKEKSTEGSNIGLYLNKDNKIKSIKMEYFGESGKSIDYIFLRKINNIFVQKEYGYNVPIYIQDSKIISKIEKIYEIKKCDNFNYIGLDQKTINRLKEIKIIAKEVCQNNLQNYQCIYSK